ncbi:MAG: NAD(P)/FAD-dependent oxidoreductase [Pseudomonadota bacterium]
MPPSSDDNPEIRVETLIVGAGPAGLATAACLDARGLPFVVIEKTAQIAPRWQQHYRRLHLHTPRGQSQLPRVGFAKGTPTYPSRAEVVDYFESYAQQFAGEVQFNTNLEQLAPTETGWRVKTNRGTYQARQVVICTGYNRIPQRPDFAPEDHAGLIHTASYRTAEDLPGPRNLVIGFGNSGAEIALDLMESGRQVEVAIRGPVNVVPRDLYGLPLARITRLTRFLPRTAQEKLTGRTLKRLYADLPDYGIQPLPYSAICQIQEHQRVPMIDVGTVAAIRDGRIKVRPGVTGLDGTTAHFSDGSQGDYEGVLLATGYRPRLASLLPGLEAELNAAGAPKRSGAELRPGLYFCGFLISTRGMLFEIGVEAEAIAAAIAQAGATPAAAATAAPA